MLRDLLQAHFGVNDLLIKIGKNSSVCLLCFALFAGCAFRNGTAKQQDAKKDKTSWELAFRFTGGKTSVPFDKLSLNGRIPEQQYSIVIANLKVAKGVIAVRYKGIGKAIVVEVYNQLKEDDKIEVLWLEAIEFKDSN